MRFVAIGIVGALALLTACSSKSSSSSSSGSSAGEASGTFSGAVVGTVTNATVIAAQNTSSNTFSVDIANEDTGQLVLTTPPQSSLGDNIALTISLAFSATPTTGTAYTMANAGGTFSGTLTFLSSDNSTSYSYAAGSASTTPSATTLTVTFTTVQVASAPVYTVHGTLDASMPGDASNTSGNVAGTTTLHLTF